MVAVADSCSVLKNRIALHSAEVVTAVHCQRRVDHRFAADWIVTQIAHLPAAGSTDFQKGPRPAVAGYYLSVAGIVHRSEFPVVASLLRIRRDHLKACCFAQGFQRDRQIAGAGSKQRIRWVQVSSFRIFGCVRYHPQRRIC